MEKMEKEDTEVRFEIWDCYTSHILEWINVLNKLKRIKLY